MGNISSRCTNFDLIHPPLASDSDDEIFKFWSSCLNIRKRIDMCILPVNDTSNIEILFVIQGPDLPNKKSVEDTLIPANTEVTKKAFGEWLSKHTTQLEFYSGDKKKGSDEIFDDIVYNGIVDLRPTLCRIFDSGGAQHRYFLMFYAIKMAETMTSIDSTDADKEQLTKDLGKVVLAIDGWLKDSNKTRGYALPFVFDEVHKLSKGIKPGANGPNFKSNNEQIEHALRMLFGRLADAL